MKDKVAGMRRLVEQMGCPTEEVCYVADGERDAPALELVGLALAPSDASASARAAADRVLASRGGAGAVEEAIALLFSPIDACGDDPAEFVRGELRAAAEAMNTVAEGEIRALARLVEVVAASLAAGGKVVLFGNGGSASTAQHVAAELVGRSRKERRPLPVIALTTDTALLTALAGDPGHEEIFERQVEALVRFGDVAVGLSTSGHRSTWPVRSPLQAGWAHARLRLLAPSPAPSVKRPSCASPFRCRTRRGFRSCIWWRSTRSAATSTAASGRGEGRQLDE